MLRRTPSYACFAALLLAVVGAGVANAQSAVSMTAVEFAFQPSTATASSGAVTFSMRNGGQFPHNIHIEDMPNDVFAQNLTSGQSASATVTLAPGTYTFFCPVGTHRQQGMEGTLTVAGAQAGRAGGLSPVVLSGVIGTVGAWMVGLALFRRRSSA